jgi:hypothetical protein
MKNLLAYILIFQINEDLSKKIPCIFSKNSSLPQRKLEVFLEHTETLSYQDACKYISDFGYPCNVSLDEFLLSQWIALHLIAQHFDTQKFYNNLVYTSLHHEVKSSSENKASKPYPSQDSVPLYWDLIWNVDGDLQRRKSLMITGVDWRFRIEGTFGGQNYEK